MLFKKNTFWVKLSMDRFISDPSNLTDTFGFISEINLLVQGHIKCQLYWEKPRACFANLSFQKKETREDDFAKLSRVAGLERHKAVFTWLQTKSFDTWLQGSIFKGYFISDNLTTETWIHNHFLADKAIKWQRPCQLGAPSIQKK